MQVRKTKQDDDHVTTKMKPSNYQKGYDLIVTVLRTVLVRLAGLQAFVPQILIRLVSFAVNCCCCLCICCVRSFITVSEDEKGRYYKLREHVRTPHEVGEEKYQRTLSILYKNCFEKNRAEANTDRVEIDPKKWTSIGFQSTEPSKDLRGGGLLALQQLSKLLQDRPKDAEEMISLTRRNLFLLACNSIRVTVFLRRLFEFDDLDCMKRLTCSLSSRTKKLKNLCAFIGQDNSGEKLVQSELANLQAYDKLHQALLLEILKEWKGLLRERPDLTILQMSLAERSVEAKFIKLVELRLYPSLNEFLKVFSAEGVCKLSQSDLNRPKAL